MGDVIDLDSYRKDEPEEESTGEGVATSPMSEVEAHNRALIDEIHRLGAQVPPIMLVHLQLDVLVNLLFPPNSTLRQVFDYEVESRLGPILEELKAAIVRDRLKV